MSRNSPRNGIRISPSLHATTWTLLSCFVARFVHSCILLVPIPRPDGWRKAETLPSPHPHRLAILNSQFSILNRIRITLRGYARRPTRVTLGVRGGSWLSLTVLFAHVSGPHHAPIIPYHVVLSSPASSEPQRHPKTKAYIPLLLDESHIGYTNYKVSSLAQPGLPPRPSFILSVSISFRPLIPFVSHNYSHSFSTFGSIELSTARSPRILPSSECPSPAPVVLLLPAAPTRIIPCLAPKLRSGLVTDIPPMQDSPTPRVTLSHIRTGSMRPRRISTTPSRYSIPLPISAATHISTVYWP
jgi:hypothetical protein